MMQHKFQIYFIFAFHVFFRRNLCFGQAILSNHEDVFSIETCARDPCSCDEFGKIRGVLCNKGSDETYELNFAVAEELPARLFRRQAIDSITLDNPIANIDENIFEEMDSLKTFNVQRSSIKIVPNFSFVKDSIRNISIDNSGLTSLDGRYLQNLTRVEYLSFRNNSIHFIDLDVFKGTENVKYLYLNYNQLTSIPPNLLAPMKNLNTFEVDFNNLLHVDKLFSTKAPQRICLKNNNIADASSVLDKNRRFFHKFTEESICNKGDIRYFDLQPLSTITILDLSYNTISDSSKPVVPCYKNSSSRHRYFIVKIEELDLTGNKIRNLGFLLRFAQISTLRMAENQIKYLTAMEFSLTKDVSTLELQKNEIRRIDTDTFVNFRRHLVCLDLSFNFITTLNGSIKHLYQLQKLNLENNSILFFATDEFVGLNQLYELRLKNNRIKTIKQLQIIPHLRFLYIENNDIELIRPDHVPKGLLSMQLADNPFQCNCDLLSFLQYLKQNSIRTDTDLCLKSNHGDRRSNCPRMCSCSCSKYEDTSFIAVDCNSQGIAWLSEFPRKILIDIETNFYFRLSIDDVVKGINLENNQLMSIPEGILPPDLIQLYLSNNKLRRLPLSIIDKQRNLKQVTLSGNPWKCDCTAMELKYWLLTKKDNIKDVGNVCCGINEDLSNKVLRNLSDTDMCPPPAMSKGTLYLILFSVLFVALSLIMIGLIIHLIYKKYALRIKLNRYCNGKATRRLPGDKPMVIKARNMQ